MNLKSLQAKTEPTKPEITSMVQRVIAIILATFLATGSALPALALGTETTERASTDAPHSILTTLNTNPDPSLAPNGTSLNILDTQTNELFKFPLQSINGGPISGQPMHSAIQANGKKIYITMGGNQTLPTRIAVITLNWLNGKPLPSLSKTIELLPAGTLGNEANGASCHPGEPGIRQEGHGPQLTTDGQYLLFSELQNNQVVAINTTTDTISSETPSSETTFAPHGLYPNPSGTRAASPHYWFDENKVSIWNINQTNGELSFEENIELKSKDFEGSYLHTARWLDDNQFITNATQDPEQGNHQSQRSVWLVDTQSKKVTPILNEEDLLEGASDTIIANNKLYVAEGNIAKFLSNQDAPGNLSIWSLSDPLSPTLIKRLSPGNGLPDHFSNAHSLAKTKDEDQIFLESFSSNYLIKIDTKSDEVTATFDSGDGLIATHGLYITD